MNFNLLNDINLKEIDTDFPNYNISNLSFDEIAMLKDIYVGSKSEFTSLAQYTYQHILTSISDDLSNFSKNIEKISIAEMRHFEIIGKILNSSSTDPKFCTFIDNNPKICNYWSSGSVNYSNDIMKFLQANIELENSGIRAYLWLKDITKNNELIKIIDRILEDEYSHIEYFKACQNALESANNKL